MQPLSQRPLSSAPEPALSVSQWRYRALPRWPSPSCAHQRAAQIVSHAPNVFFGTSNTSTAVAYNPNSNADHVLEISDNRDAVKNGAPEASNPMPLRQPDSSFIFHQQDFSGQCYSPSTVSAMARLMGHHDGQELVLAAGQASAVVLPKTQLLNVLKAGSHTPLDEVSAALALLCETGQYDAVIQYGNPLLKAASAAVPFSSPLRVAKPPVPHLERLAADIALSIALAHISLAGGAGSGAGGSNSSSDSSSGGSGQALLSAGGSGGDFGECGLIGLEEVYGHLESALQVLERNSAAAALQQEVSYCLQGVAVAFAEEVLRSTSPVSSLPAAAAPAPVPGGQASAAGTAARALPSSLVNAAAAGSLGSTADGGGGSSNAANRDSSSIGSSPTAVAARRAKAIAVLRGALWKGAPSQNRYHNHHRQPQQVQQQQRQHGDSHAAEHDVLAAAAAATGSTPSEVSSGGSGGGGWVPELTPDERSEFMAPLRGLLAASEHIALYGPVASGQKPYGAVHLSDQELYDLAIAHLAQGVSTGWPQHVLQALSYLERVAQQQQQQGAASASTASAAAADADVSFERSVCEVLLGRRTTAVGLTDSPQAASAVSSGSATGVSSGGGAPASLPYSGFGGDWEDGDESALLRRLEAQLMAAPAGVGGGDEMAAAGAGAGASGLLERAPGGAAASFEVDERGDVDGGGSGSGDWSGGGAGKVEAARGSTGPREAVAAAAATTATASGARDAGRSPPPNATARGAVGPGGEKMTPVATAVAPPAAAAAAAVTATTQQQSQQHQQAASHSGRTRHRDREDDVARKYGWAESWLELSVMPCFPETAGGGSVSLAKWFTDPRVILFSKLLAVRSSSGEVHMTAAALGSAVAHVSDASRQRLWQLWQAAAQAVSSARGQNAHPHHNHQQQQLQQTASAASVATAAAPVKKAAAAGSRAKVGDGGGGGSGGGGAPVASGLLAHSLAALQDVAPRAAAAANAVAAAVGSAAASSPRAVAAAAGWMVPFSLARWGSAEKSVPAPPGGGRTAVTAQALHRTAAVAATAATATTTATATAADPVMSGSTDDTVLGVRPTTGARQRLLSNADGRDGAHHDLSHIQRGSQMSPPSLPPPLVTGPPGTNNVVPFPSGGHGGGGGGGGSAAAAATFAMPIPMPLTAAPVAAPVAGGLVDVAVAAPPSNGAATDAADANAAGGGSLWVPDAEGHLQPRPRMVTRAVQRAAAAAASIKERVATLPGAPLDWAMVRVDQAATDEAMSREAVWRVAAVAAQAVCLGALAAYVGNRIVASGALQAAAASGAAAAAAVTAPTVDASTAQVVAAARAVARWLGDSGMGSAAQEALGQWPQLLLQRGVGGGHEAELLPFRVEAVSAESVGRLAEQYGRSADLDETAAAALVRGWAAARAAAPSLADPRGRSELLSCLLGGRALRMARAEAERNARMGRRVQVQRIDVEVEQLCVRPHGGVGDAAAMSQLEVGQSVAEVSVKAVVVTAGTETSRASPLPVSYCTRERLTLTFRRTLPEVPPPPGTAAPAGAAAAKTAAQGAVWRLVDVRDAPPALY